MSNTTANSTAATTTAAAPVAAPLDVNIPNYIALTLPPKADTAFPVFGTP